MREMVSIDFEAWPRHREVLQYAAVNMVTVEKAIEQLVNSGLSHEPRSYVNQIGE